MVAPKRPMEMDRVQGLPTVQTLARVRLIHWNFGWMQVLLAVLIHHGPIVVVSLITRPKVVLQLL